MRLSRIIEGVNAVSVSGRDPEITALCCDSGDVAEGALFFCISGTRVDGHDFAGDALARGAVALVVERPLPFAVPQVLVKSCRSAMSEAAAAFYGYPARDMLLVGITGTNGKTTTSFILRNILEKSGLPTGLIGTTAVFIGADKQDAGLTTPDPIDLHRIFRDMRSAGMKAVVMEVSAHALALNKLDGVLFDCAVFTNLSQDHLDFFGDMQSYAAAKLRFFDKRLTRLAVVNIDDPCGRQIAACCNVPCVTYGALNPADVFAVNYKSSVEGLEYVLNAFDDVTGVRFKLPGGFNMYNTLCAAAVAARLGVCVRDIAAGIAQTAQVPGRFNLIRGDDFSVIVDFAHTPDGLENILRCVGEIAQGRIIVVFGCGGDRDHEKRPLMGRIAAQYSDYVIITSDNPRTERPLDIMQQIEQGAATVNDRYIMLADRTEAIKYAVRIACKGDIVLVAGKGDERYQDINGKKIPYYDNEVVEAALKSAAKAAKSS